MTRDAEVIVLPSSRSIDVADIVDVQILLSSSTRFDVPFHDQAASVIIRARRSG